MLLFRSSVVWVMDSTWPWLMFTVALVPVVLLWSLFRVTAPTLEMMPLTVSWVPVPLSVRAPISLLATFTRLLLPVSSTAPVILL